MRAFYGLCSILALAHASVRTPMGENEFDTYNGDCKRLRKPWATLSQQEKNTYLKAVLLLREQGQGQMSLDELVAIGSAHMDDEGENQHQASTYLFWHGYLLWELESRIRNLGGEFECFGMPYWDFSGDPDSIFEDILGGSGDPNNYWTVNGYSWEYTTKQYWVPAHCDAEGDHYPLCSLKRAVGESSQTITSEAVGQIIIDSTKFEDFSPLYASQVGIPRNLLTAQPYLLFPVVTSYDPIWYLFHSMVSYHQAIWTDCHDYDQIAPEDLDKNSDAYSAFCTEDYNCGNMDIDAMMKFGGLLPDKDWAFIHNNQLTVRKSYHFPRWNIQYDLGDGGGFFRASGLEKYCQGKLNPDWFIVTKDEQANLNVLDGGVENGVSFAGNLVSYHSLSMITFFILIFGLAMYFVFRKSAVKKGRIINDFEYGSIPDPVCEEQI